jgi:predicted ATP-dependent endonuclease of OLD family
MMRLSAFRIRNFRSIVDTGWQYLSPDNITCLIGQNESGKTSVLEGLKAFYSGVISEDVLRSDLSMPEISCLFNIPKGWLLQIISNPRSGLRELLAELDHLELTRFWIEDFSSVVKVSGEISRYLDSLDSAWSLYLDEVRSKLERELNVINEMQETYDTLKKTRAELEEKLPEDAGAGINFRLFRRKAKESAPLDEKQGNELRKRLKEIVSQEEASGRELMTKSGIKKTVDTYVFKKGKVNQLEENLSELKSKLEERHQRMTLLMKPVGDDDNEWKGVLDDYRRLKKDHELATSELSEHIVYSGYVMEGDSEEEAKKKADEITQTYKSKFTSEILGKNYFEHSPVFELFEDFGSLLPNRVDLEDIINGNDQVEGYKAARNFLTIARLEYSFFQQPSSRILKQKIENLNHTLTINFHDFWQQSIGRNNKIRIQFELEHYNSTFGEKAGKPYLEFWIKDEGERLYPKQRSRGVRWFLSFYLELKASATLSERPIVLLVDEPGVSLHARAQEDVLKVFEDIKDKIQVIYTTHSPHLVDINKLHRVLAIQRDDLDNLKSNTRVLDPLRLTDASPDTLSPLQSIMGNPLGAEGFSSERLNLIVNDIGSFYMITAILQLTGFKGKVSLIPSTEVSSIPLMCNILMGWGLRFGVLLFSNEGEKKMEEFLKHTMFRTDKNESELVTRLSDTFLNSEDLLSTLDFKSHVLKSREGITVQNSVYLAEKELPRNFLLSKFLAEVKTRNITMSDLDEESGENFRQFVNLITGLK